MLFRNKIKVIYFYFYCYYRDKEKKKWRVLVDLIFFEIYN